MFTGIIQHVGVVTAAEASAAGRRLSIDLGPLADGLSAGDSVAVCGACLTAAGINGIIGQFDVVFETLDRSTLGRLATGSRVNLERALRVGDGLDGHFVQGHVDGKGRIDRIDRNAGRWEIHLTCPNELTDQMVPKGSVAVDGVSLTLATLGEGRFSVAIIPTTLEATTLGERKVGDAVNIETDVLGKYVRRMLGPDVGGGVTIEALRRAGFA